MSLSHSNIAHNWAHRVANRQGEVAGKGGHMFYEGEKIYSYGRHFCIARLLPDNVVVMGTHTYSLSTSKHQYLVSAAVSHLRKVFCHDPDRMAYSNREKAEQKIKNELENAVAPRIRKATRLGHIAEARRLAEEFNEYLAALPDKEQGITKPLPVPEMSDEQMDQQRQLALEAEKKRAEARKERDRIEELEMAEKLKMWRRHEYSGYLYQSSGNYAIRLSKDGKEIETTGGALIPVAHAKRLWPFIQNCKAVGKGLTDRDIRLGHFRLTEIKPNGDIVVGCHNIAYEELEMMAKQLGLMETEDV